MANLVRAFAEVIGIANSLPENPKYFTEVSISDTLSIVDGKPDMEELLAIMVDPEVISSRIVETPVSVSNEGQNLSGGKMLVELRLREKVKYIADKPCQSVHAIYYENILKSIVVMIPFEINGQPTKELIRRKKVNITPYVEDIYAEMRDKRTMLNNVTILIDVKFLGV